MEKTSPEKLAAIEGFLRKSHKNAEKSIEQTRE